MLQLANCGTLVKLMLEASADLLVRTHVPNLDGVVATSRNNHVLVGSVLGTGDSVGVSPRDGGHNFAVFDGPDPDILHVCSDKVIF